MYLKSIALSPLLILAFGSVSAIVLDTLTPTLAQAPVNLLAEAERLLEEGDALEEISEWSQSLEKVGYGPRGMASLTPVHLAPSI